METELLEKFNDLKKSWKEDTQFLSNINLIVTNEHYLKIIELGEDVIPFIYDDLCNDGGHWFIALEQITGHIPIENFKGSYRLAKKYWIDKINELYFNV